MTGHRPADAGTVRYDGHDLYANKPSQRALRAAARHLGLPAAEIAVVGDDPELEVPMAHKGGAMAVAVHTGIGHAQSFRDLPEEVQPHLDLPDVVVLAGLLKSA